MHSTKMFLSRNKLWAATHALLFDKFGDLRDGSTSLKLGVRVHSAVFPAGACVTPAAAAVLPDTASPGSGTVLATTWRRSPGRGANGIGNIESGHGERVAARVRTTFAGAPSTRLCGG